MTRNMIKQGNLLLWTKKKGLCMFSYRNAYIEKSLTHTHKHNMRKIYTTGIRINKKTKSHRINVSVVTQKITDEVKLQVQ